MSAAQAISQPAMIDDLRTLVNIDSPSRDIEALKTSAAAVKAFLENRLGGEAKYVDTEGGRVVHWCGPGEPQVLLLGHHDTVFPLGTVAQRPFAVTDGHATGPGVFDMLGGIVQAVHGIATLEDHTGIEILLTADEEVGSLASKDLLEERALACGSVLVAEGSADGGALKIGRKGCGTFTVTITGRASHAGLDPEKGINALVEAAHQVLAINQIGDASIGTTVTPTVAKAGTADNVVPAQAVIYVDARVETLDEKARVEAAMEALTPVVDGASITVEGGVRRPPMTQDAAKELFDMAQRVMPEIDGVAVGGGSDGNYTAAAGARTLDGLGAVGGGAHADHEYLIVDKMEERAALIAGLIKEIRGF